MAAKPFKSSEEAYLSSKLSGAKSSVREVITRVNEFQETVERVDVEISNLRHKINRPENCELGFAAEIDIFNSTKELEYAGQRMQKLTARSIECLQSYVDKMIQILSSLNEINGSDVEIRQNEGRKRSVEERSRRKSTNEELASVYKSTTSKRSIEREVLYADSSEDEISQRKKNGQFHSRIIEAEVSDPIQKNTSNSEEVLGSTTVKKDSLHRHKKKFKQSTDTSGREEFVTFNNNLGEDDNLGVGSNAETYKWNRPTTSKAQLSELDNWDIKSIREKTSKHKYKNFMGGSYNNDEESGLVKDDDETDEVMKRKSKKVSTKEKKVESSPRVRPIFFVNKDSKFLGKPYQMNRERTVREEPSSSMAGLPSGQNDLSKKRQRNWEKHTFVPSQNWSTIGKVFSPSREHFSAKSKFSGAGVKLRKNMEQATRQNITEESEIPSINNHCSTSEESSDESVKKKTATAVSKRTEKSEVEESDISSDSNAAVDLCNSEEIHLGAGNFWESERRYSKSQNIPKNKDVTHSKRYSGNTVNEKNRLGKVSDEHALVAQNDSEMYANEFVEKQIISKRIRSEPEALQNGKMRREERIRTEAEQDEHIREERPSQGKSRAIQNRKTRPDGIRAKAGRDVSEVPQDELVEEGSETPLSEEEIHNRKTRLHGRVRSEAREPVSVARNLFRNNFASRNEERITVQYEEERSQSARRHDYTQRIGEIPDSYSAIDFDDLPDMYSSYHRIMQQFLELQSHNNTCLDQLESVFEHISDIYRSDSSLDSESADQIRGLSLAEIHSLPISKYSKHYRKNPEKRNRDTKCSICLSQYVDGEFIRNFPCLHDFHATCVDTWLERSNTCPTCRRKICVD